MFLTHKARDARVNERLSHAAWNKERGITVDCVEAAGALLFVSELSQSPLIVEGCKRVNSLYSFKPDEEKIPDVNRSGLLFGEVISRRENE